MSRSGKAAIGIVALLLALGAIGYAADRWIAARAADRIESEISTSFPEATGVRAELPGTLFLPQVLTGKIDATVHADGVTHLGLNVTDVVIEANGVTTADPRTVDDLTVTATVPKKTIAAAAKSSGRLPEGVELAIVDGEFSATVSVLGREVGAVLEPVVADGALTFHTDSVLVGDVSVPIANLPGVLADAVDGLTEVKVPLDTLPESMTLFSAEVLENGIRVQVHGTGIALDDLA